MSLYKVVKVTLFNKDDRERNRKRQINGKINREKNKGDRDKREIWIEREKETEIESERERKKGLRGR